MRAMAKNILLAGAVLGACFLVLEIVLHIVFPLGLTNPANTTYELTHPEYNMTITTNSFGLRDRDFTKEVPEGVYRILVIGDSFTFGIGVQNNETYPKIFELELNKDPSARIEVLNVGKSGIGPQEYLELLKHYSQVYDYDIVVVGFYVGNDVIDSKDPYINEGLISLLKKSRIVTMTFNLVTRLAQRNTSKVSNILVFNAKRAPQFFEDSLLLESDDVKESMAQAMTYILDMGEYSQSHGKKMVVLVIPQAMQVDKKYHAFFSGLGFDVRDEFLTNPRAQTVLDAFLEKNGIVYIDLLSDLKGHDDLYFLTDDHMNTKGQEFIGKVFAKKVLNDTVH